MTSNQHHIVRPFLFPLLLALLLLLFDRLGFLTPVHRVVAVFANPAREVMFGVRQQIFGSVSFDTIAQKNDLISQLQNDLAKRLVEQTEITRLREENESLRRQLEAPFAPDVVFLPAHIVGASDTEVILNVGSDDGIATGMAVVSENNLVGRVSRVQPKSSVVQLPMHPDSTLAAETVATGARGLLVKKGGSLVLDQILQESDIAIDAIVVTSGVDVPRDLIVGVVTDVQAAEQDLFQVATVRSVFDYIRLKMVFVIIE